MLVFWGINKRLIQAIRDSIESKVKKSDHDRALLGKRKSTFLKFSESCGRPHAFERSTSADQNKIKMWDRICDQVLSTSCDIKFLYFSGIRGPVWINVVGPFQETLAYNMFHAFEICIAIVVGWACDRVVWWGSRWAGRRVVDMTWDFFFAAETKNGKTALTVSTKKGLAYPLGSADLDVKGVISSRCECVAFRHHVFVFFFVFFFFFYGIIDDYLATKYTLFRSFSSV